MEHALGREELKWFVQWRAAINGAAGCDSGKTREKKEKEKKKNRKKKKIVTRSVLPRSPALPAASAQGEGGKEPWRVAAAWFTHHVQPLCPLLRCLPAA